MRRLLVLVSLLAAVATTVGPVATAQADDDRCYFVEATIPPDYNPNAHVCPPGPQGVHIGDPL